MILCLVEAVCLASAISSFGYVFPVDWNHLANEDGSLYRFQSRHFWPSHHYDPDNTDYGEEREREAESIGVGIFVLAIYLAKRSLRSKGKHGLTDHETVDTSTVVHFSKREVPRSLWFMLMTKEPRIMVT